MPKTFNPDTEIPDLSGKAIVVTGGTYLTQHSATFRLNRMSPNSAVQHQNARPLRVDGR